MYCSTPTESSYQRVAWPDEVLFQTCRPMTNPETGVGARSGGVSWADGQRNVLILVRPAV